MNSSMAIEKKRSWESQLIMMVDDLLTSVNWKKETDIILLEFSNAFDKLSHEQLSLK